MMKRLLVTALLAVALPWTAQAATNTALIGPRFGVSLDPDQLVLGGQLVTPPVAPHLTFDPSLELGLGDDQTVVAINLDMFYHFELRNTQWSPYAGLGVGINWFSIDRPAPENDLSSSEVGANVVLGVDVPTSRGSVFFSELRAGVGDIPEMKIVAGWNFALR